MLAHIDDAVQRNKRLDPHVRCTHRDAIVYIDTGESAPVYTRPYRIPHHMQEQAEVTFRRLFESGTVVEAPAGTTWLNSLLAVPKKDAVGNKTKVRITIDFRNLNSIMCSDDRFTLPLIEDLIEKLGGSSVFTSIDLIDSYHQFTICEEHRPKTSFMYKGRQYMLSERRWG